MDPRPRNEITYSDTVLLSSPQVLTRYLARRGSGALAGTRVLELGSGTGLVGLLAGALGAHVYITDQACVSSESKPPTPTSCSLRHAPDARG